MPEYEVVWSGATHRQFPVLPAPPAVVYRDQQPRSRKTNNYAQVLDALRESWMSLEAVSARVGMSKRWTWHYLQRLIAEGEAAVLIVAPTRQGGRQQRLYRRRRQTQEAARECCWPSVVVGGCVAQTRLSLLAAMDARTAWATMAPWPSGK